ncbi:MAG: M23 family metallopeptidase [Deltaproteobacteria bacterium]|nr:MAG: M23 family metallopeptidase [Deltaproteobacteria bacterium]
MFAPEMKLPKITPLLLLAGLNLSVHAAEPLKVCVETSLRGYTSNSFEVASSINLYPDEEVSLVSGVETINPRNGVSMVEVDYNGENVWVAREYLKESCYEEPHMHGEHQVPTQAQLDAHEIDRSRPHSLTLEIPNLKGNLLPPVDECRPCGKYKMRSSYFHPGEDLCTDKQGVPTNAIYTGIVVEVTDHCTDDFYEGKTWENRSSTTCKNSRGFGNRVMLMHLTKDRVWYSGYHHLGEVSVKEGELVLPGQKVGTVGSTGVSFNYHLHFEIVDGKDPGAYSHIRTNPRSYYNDGRICKKFFYDRRN